MITKCPAPLLKKEGLMDPKTGEEIVYNPPGFNYNDELEAIVIEATALAAACKDQKTKQEMKERWNCSTFGDLDHQYWAKFCTIAKEALLHKEKFQQGQTAEYGKHDYCVNNEVRVLQIALERVRDTSMPMRATEWP